MNWRYCMVTIVLGAAVGCDGKDPERLNKVGKKLVEKSKRLADDSNLPKVSVTMPDQEKAVVQDKKDKSEPAAAVRGAGANREGEQK